MSRAVFCSLFAAALALGLAFRLARPDARPMHHDEANEAVKFGTLLETGEYRYDRHDHHGPTLYYLTLPVAWARRQTSLASLDERTLRAVPALFGAGLILLFPILARGLGRGAVATSALLAALSPALTYYNRFYIHESLFAFFALGFLIALGRYVLRPRTAWAIGAGAFAGLVYATKETSAILFVTAPAACVLARAWTEAMDRRSGRPWAPGAGPAGDRGDVPPSSWMMSVAHAAAGLAAALAIAVLFYSSFFRNPAGIFESVRAFGVYASRGIDPGLHAHPWDYYLRLLSFSRSGGLVWSEGLILGLAVAGMVFAFGRSAAGFWPRYIGLYALITAVAFSAVRYKTPWNLLPFYVGFILMAGSGAVALVESARARVVREFLVIALLAASWHLAVENWRANFRYPADPRNPYVYAQTSTDFLRLVTRVGNLAALHPDGARMLIKVIAGPYEQWPLPWYARRMPRVGYWPTAGEAGRLDAAPVIVASQDNADAVEAALGDRYVSEFYGLRPGVILTLYIERSLWERFLESRQQQAGRPVLRACEEFRSRPLKRVGARSCEAVAPDFSPVSGAPTRAELKFGATPDGRRRFLHRL